MDGERGSGPQGGILQGAAFEGWKFGILASALQCVSVSVYLFLIYSVHRLTVLLTWRVIKLRALCCAAFCIECFTYWRVSFRDAAADDLQWSEGNHDNSSRTLLFGLRCRKEWEKCQEWNTEITLETLVFLFHLLSATSKPFSSLSTRLAHAARLGLFFLQKRAI